MITRSKMRRQLYSGGGITDLYPRQKYGIGSWVKERVRKLIPNELADVAVKAAPFVAPFNPAIAGIMRGVGRFDQRGSISDALKQGLATTALGAGARYLGGAAPMGGGLKGGFTSPIQQGGPISNMFKGFTGKTTTPVAKATPPGGGATAFGSNRDFYKAPSDQGFFSKVLFGKEGGTGMFGDKGLIGAGGEFDLGQSFGKGVPAVFAGSTIAAYAAQKALGDVGERESGESLEAYNKRRKGTVGQYLDFYYRRANRFRIPPEDMDAAAAKFVADNTKEYVSQGGRIGYQTGGITMANTLQENIRRNQAQAAANEGVLAAARSKLPGYTAPVVQRSPEQNYQAYLNLNKQSHPTAMKPYDAENTTYTAFTPTPEVASPRTVTPEESPLTVMPSPQYKDPLPKDELMSGFEEYIRNNPDAMSGIGTSAMMPVTLPGGYEYDFSGSTEANAFNKYSDSIGQAPYTRRQSPINMKGPLGIVPPPFREDSGDFGPDGIVIDGKRYYSEKEAIADMGIERYNMFMSKGGRVGYSDGSKYITPRIGDLLEADLGGGPLENIVKMGMTVRAPLIDVIRMVYGTGKKATEIIGKAAKLGWDITKPARQAIGYASKKGLEGTKFALGQSDKFRYGTKNYWALRASGMSDDEARLFLQDNKVGEFRKDKNLIKKLESRLMDEKVRESPDVISMSEVSLYPGREKTKRMGQMGGTGPNGLPGIPKQAPDGMEFDMRQNGGFQPLGAKEKKDDVPAMLAKNEFVFTADAVRGAGNGDIELGAQKMYDTMKNLERRVT